MFKISRQNYIIKIITFNLYYVMLIILSPPFFFKVSPLKRCNFNKSSDVMLKSRHMPNIDKATFSYFG